MITATAYTALETAIAWMREVVQLQPYGEITISITMQCGNIVMIRKAIQETEKP